MAGLVSTIFFIYFLEPIFNFLGNIVIHVSKVLSKSIYDRIFIEAALGKPDYSFIILQIITISILMFSTLMIIGFFPPKKENVDDNNPISASTPEGDSLVKQNKGKQIILKIFLLLLLVCGVVSIVLSDIKLKTIEMFEQQIKIITPYVDNQTKDMLISKFSSMKSYDDYMKIQNEINEIARNNELKLPEYKMHFF